MDHPVVKEIERYGYPDGYEERKHYGIDALGNDVYKGDEILVYEDEFFLVEALISETIEALEIVGAKENLHKKTTLKKGSKTHQIISCLYFTT